FTETFKGADEFFKKLASASEVEIVDTFSDSTAVQIITDSATVYIPLADMIDFEAERKRLTEELKKNDGEIKRLEGKLSNEGFVAKAPAAVVEGEKAKLAKYQEIRKGLEEALAKLG
ncbi:MAG: valine--tRNA ligase, partial [Oscillospiraceae bacterium]|nr:valine--tRNA ligase [Oscillospiraceae bacterium]